MNNLPIRKILYFFPAAAGVLGLLLRFWLYGTGVDEKGLLIPSHPTNVLVFILLAITMAAMVLCVTRLPQQKLQKPFPKSLAGAVGCAVAAAGIVIGSISELSSGDSVSTVSLVLSIIAAACFVLLGLSRSKGQKASLLFCCATCVYFMVHLISQYRLWSAEPQLQTYFFPLLSSVLLMLCCYHRCVLDIKGTGLKQYAFFNRAALFCCLVSMNTENWSFYFAMACWTAAELYLPEEQSDEAAE